MNYQDKLKLLNKEEFLLLNASDIKTDCQSYEYQSAYCQVYGKPDCSNCCNYVKGENK